MDILRQWVTSPRTRIRRGTYMEVLRLLVEARSPISVIRYVLEETINESGDELVSMMTVRMQVCMCLQQPILTLARPPGRALPASVSDG